MNCPDLCTKAKCEELENRIIELENIVEQLKQINISGQLTNESLNIEINNSFNSDTASIDLSDFCTDERLDDHISTEINENSSLSHDYNPTVMVALDVVNILGRYFLDVLVSVDGNDGSDTASWNASEDLNFEQVFVDVTEPSGGQQEIFVSVKINGVVHSDTAILSANNNNIINIDGSYQNEILTLTVATDTNTDTATILIPLQQNVDNTVNNFINNDLDTKIYNIINNTMNCDLTPAIMAIENCCQILVTENNQNQALLDALYYLIELRTGQLETKANDIFTEVTKTIAGTNYIVDCELYDENGNLKEDFALKDEDGNIILDEDENPILTQKTEEITGSSFQGLADLMTKLNQQIGDTNLTLCDLGSTVVKQVKEEIETFDTVAVVASERDLTRIQGDKLILHFVTFDNYPKRQTNSSYRPIQIPDPIDELVSPNTNNIWEQYFENIVWNQGNFYCELQLKTEDDILVKPPVSGYFKSKASADEFFDIVLLLTNLSEGNRKYHEFETPKKNIAVQETRPYRAFITSVNEEGKATCQTKFLPPIE